MIDSENKEKVKNPDRMDYFEAKLSFGEILLLLFGRKRCSLCDVKLKRMYKKDFSGVELRDNSSLADAYREFNIHEVSILYKCPKCDKIYQLKDLSKNR